MLYCIDAERVLYGQLDHMLEIGNCARCVLALVESSESALFGERHQLYTSYIESAVRQLYLPHSIIVSQCTSLTHC